MSLMNKPTLYGSGTEFIRSKLIAMVPYTWHDMKIKNTESLLFLQVHRDCSDFCRVLLQLMRADMTDYTCHYNDYSIIDAQFYYLPLVIEA
jgi:hypothetical protein